MKRIITTLCLVAFMALTTWAQDYTYYYKGQMGGRVSVEIAFQKFASIDTDIIAGYIYYPKAKNLAPILLVGNEMQKDYFVLHEYQSDGIVSGWLTLQLSADGTITEGEWTNPKTGTSFSLKPLKSTNRPAWWSSDPLTYDTPDNIGREYSYQQWNRNYDSMMGGNVTFTAAGKNKVHFYVSNCPGNIAEGGSEKGRPAVLDGPQFTYDNVNECGYGFKATFFKKFVVLETTTDYETTHCFGMNATFAGVYIKTKQ